MYPCHYPNCKETFDNHTFLMNHILRDHGNGRLVALVVAIVLTLALLLPAKADSTEPPSVGDPPTMLRLVYLPLVATGQEVKAAVSWCPSCRG